MGWPVVLIAHGLRKSIEEEFVVYKIDKRNTFNNLVSGQAVLDECLRNYCFGTHPLLWHQLAWTCFV